MSGAPNAQPVQAPARGGTWQARLVEGLWRKEAEPPEPGNKHARRLYFPGDDDVPAPSGSSITGPSTARRCPPCQLDGCGKTAGTLNHVEKQWLERVARSALVRRNTSFMPTYEEPPPPIAKAPKRHEYAVLDKRVYIWDPQAAYALPQPTCPAANCGRPLAFRRYKHRRVEDLSGQGFLLYASYECPCGKTYNSHLDTGEGALMQWKEWRVNMPVVVHEKAVFTNKFVAMICSVLPILPLTKIADMISNMRTQKHLIRLHRWSQHSKLYQKCNPTHVVESLGTMVDHCFTNIPYSPDCETIQSILISRCHQLRPILEAQIAGVRGSVWSSDAHFNIPSRIQERDLCTGRFYHPVQAMNVAVGETGQVGCLVFVNRCTTGQRKSSIQALADRHKLSHTKIEAVYSDLCCGDQEYLEPLTSLSGQTVPFLDIAHLLGRLKKALGKSATSKEAARRLLSAISHCLTDESGVATTTGQMRAENIQKVVTSFQKKEESLDAEETICTPEFLDCLETQLSHVRSCLPGPRLHGLRTVDRSGRHTVHRGTNECENLWRILRSVWPESTSLIYADSLLLCSVVDWNLERMVQHDIKFPFSKIPWFLLDRYLMLAYDRKVLRVLNPVPLDFDGLDNVFGITKVLFDHLNERARPLLSPEATTRISKLYSILAHHDPRAKERTLCMLTQGLNGIVEVEDLEGAFSNARRELEREAKAEAVEEPEELRGAYDSDPEGGDGERAPSEDGSPLPSLKSVQGRRGRQAATGKESSSAGKRTRPNDFATILNHAKGRRYARLLGGDSRGSLGFGSWAAKASAFLTASQEDISLFTYEELSCAVGLYENFIIKGRLADIQSEDIDGEKLAEIWTDFVTGVRRSTHPKKARIRYKTAGALEEVIKGQWLLAQLHKVGDDESNHIDANFKEAHGKFERFVKSDEYQAAFESYHPHILAAVGRTEGRGPSHGASASRRHQLPSHAQSSSQVSLPSRPSSATQALTQSHMPGYAPQPQSLSAPQTPASAMHPSSSTAPPIHPLLLGAPPPSQAVAAAWMMQPSPRPFQSAQTSAGYSVAGTPADIRMLASGQVTPSSSVSVSSYHMHPEVPVVPPEVFTEVIQSQYRPPFHSGTTTLPDDVVKDIMNHMKGKTVQWARLQELWAEKGRTEDETRKLKQRWHAQTCPSQRPDKRAATRTARIHSSKRQRTEDPGPTTEDADLATYAAMEDQDMTQVMETSQRMNNIRASFASSSSRLSQAPTQTTTTIESQRQSLRSSMTRCTESGPNGSQCTMFNMHLHTAPPNMPALLKPSDKQPCSLAENALIYHLCVHEKQTVLNRQGNIDSKKLAGKYTRYAQILIYTDEVGKQELLARERSKLMQRRADIIKTIRKSSAE